MNQAAQDKLRELHQRLVELEPYPWEPVEAWIASAKPLIRAYYREHFDDFLTATATPHWYAAIRIAPGPYSDVDPRNQERPWRDSLAEAAASEHRENQQRTRATKEKILAFVNGLLDLPATAGDQVASSRGAELEGHMRPGLWLVHTVIGDHVFNELLDIKIGSGRIVGKGKIERPPGEPVQYDVAGTFISPRLVQYTLKARESGVIDYVVGMIRLDDESKAAAGCCAVAGTFSGNDKELPVVAHVHLWWKDGVRDHLRDLRRQLVTIPPHPWESVQAWTRMAKPFIRTLYHDQLDAFCAVTGTTTNEEPKRAATTKERILTFLDDLLDLPSDIAPKPLQTGATRTMPKDAGSLDHDQLLNLRAAIMSARLSGSRPALLTHIPAEFMATLPVAPVPGEQVLMDLDALNRAGELAGGSLPLATWLANAVALAGGRQEAKVFQEALERVRSAPATTPVRTTPSQGTGQPVPSSVPAEHHHHGDIIMGSKFTTNISGDTKIGAFGQGDGITVTGSLTVNTGATGTVTQEQHKAAITQAQNALNADQDALERIDERLYEALGQFLTMARKIQVEQQSMAQVQAKMKETLDEVWAQQAAKGLRPQALPEGLKVVEALAKSPITAEVAKKLLLGA